MEFRLATACCCAWWLVACGPAQLDARPYEGQEPTAEGEGARDPEAADQSPAAGEDTAPDEREPANARDVQGVPAPAPANTNGSPAAPKAEVEEIVASSAFPRLSHRQWALAAQELLQLEQAPDVSGFSPDSPTGTGFDNTGDRLEVFETLWLDYQSSSEALAAQVAADPQQLAKVSPAELPEAQHERGRAFVAHLGKRAFRRPLNDAERDTYAALFEQAAMLWPGRDPFAAGAELTISAFLQAPAFLYRVEQAHAPGADGSAALSDHEIAARLSFMLWDSLPDAELTAQADAGKLHTLEQIAQQAERMLRSPRAADKLVDFHRQLLELRRYDSLHPTGLPHGIGAALRSETEQFVRAALVDGAGSFADLFTSSYSFVNAELAALYGVSGEFGSEFRRVELNPNQRSGVLTQLGFLISHSGETAPIQRGVFVNRKILCAMLPPPPMFVLPKSSGTTRRERIDSMTGKGTCGEGCHARMINPAGFPFESFDDQGRHRSEDNGQPVNTAASYALSDGVKDYGDAVAWSRVIASSQQAHECYAKHWLEFAFERRAAAGDAVLVRRIAEASRKRNISVRELLSLLLQSESARRRRSEDP